MNYSHKYGPAQESGESPANDAAARSRIPAWKRALDITCVLATAICWAPVALMIGAFIKIVSPGPVIFKQERIGHKGKIFQCLKFRTMIVNADTSVHRKHLDQLMTSNQPMKKLDIAGDARLIPGGLWLAARSELTN